MLRIVRKRLHPTAKLRLMHTQVSPGLRIRYAAILDQPHSLKLKLAGKLPSLHDPPPAPSKHLTRCLRNRVQATSIQFGSTLRAADLLERSRSFGCRPDCKRSSRLSKPTYCSRCDNTAFFHGDISSGFPKISDGTTNRMER